CRKYRSIVPIIQKLNTLFDGPSKLLLFYHRIAKLTQIMSLALITQFIVKMALSSQYWFVRTASPDELTMMHFLFIAIALLGLYIGCYLIAYKKGHNMFMGILVMAMASILLELT